MGSGRSAPDVGPHLAKELPEVFPGEQAQGPGGRGGPAVAARFPLHQDELDVVLDDRVGLVGLPEEPSRAPIDLVGGVRDLAPDDRRQIVEAEPPAALLDGSMKGDHRMPAGVPSPRKADVAHHAHEASAGDQRFAAHAPDLVELIEELVVILDPAQLAVVPAILLEGPVGRGGQDQVDRSGGKAGGASVPEEHPVLRGDPLHGGSDRRHGGGVLRETRQVPRGVLQVPEGFGNESVQHVVGGHSALCSRRREGGRPPGQPPVKAAARRRTVQRHVGTELRRVTSCGGRSGGRGCRAARPRGGSRRGP